MCLLTLAIDQSRRFPLVVAANRDENFARPAARLAWWTPRPGAPQVLSGRDLDGVLGGNLQRASGDPEPAHTVRQPRGYEA